MEEGPGRGISPKVCLRQRSDRFYRVCTSCGLIGGGLIIAADALGDVVEWRFSKMADCIESQDPDGVSCS